jgi:hypothetical protein
MTKKDIETKKPKRSDVRHELYVRLCQTLDEMPLSDIAKGVIRTEWLKTGSRLAKLDPTEKQWSAMSGEELWQEYKVVEKYFKNLSIFSLDFYAILSSRWNDLWSTFNPYSNNYKD